MAEKGAVGAVAAAAAISGVDSAMVMRQPFLAAAGHGLERIDRGRRLFDERPFAGTKRAR